MYVSPFKWKMYETHLDLNQKRSEYLRELKKECCPNDHLLNENKKIEEEEVRKRKHTRLGASTLHHTKAAARFTIWNRTTFTETHSFPRTFFFFLSLSYLHNSDRLMNISLFYSISWLFLFLFLFLSIIISILPFHSIPHDFYFSPPCVLLSHFTTASPITTVHLPPLVSTPLSLNINSVVSIHSSSSSVSPLFHSPLLPLSSCSPLLAPMILLTGTTSIPSGNSLFLSSLNF